MRAPFDHAEAYRAAGWQGPLALPAREKGPPDTGFTGYAGRWPTKDNLERWRAEGRENIGLRVQRGVIGLDVDCYDGKPGARTLVELVTKWGELPSTWMSTSRVDGSGIRWFRYSHSRHPIPDDGWPTDAGPGIELIRFAHRYAVVWPSIHPEGRVYRWIRPDGTVADGEIPSPGDLAELPDTWLEGLTGFSTNGKRDPGHVRPGSRAERHAREREAREWLRGLHKGEPCRYVGRLAADGRAAATREMGSAYDHTRDAVLALIRAGEVGHSGVGRTLKDLCELYVQTVSDKRSENVARGEFARFTFDAVLKVIDGPSGRAGAGCDCGPGPETDGRRQDVNDEFDLTHDGLALELGEQWQDARYVDGWGRWLFFTGSFWEVDETLIHMTRCREHLRRKAERLEQLSNETTNEKDAERLRRAAKTLRSAPTVAQVVGLARSNPGQAAGIEQWDRNPLQMGSPTPRKSS